MNKHPENIAIICAFGILLLMVALGSTIFLGTSLLITPQPYTDLTSAFTAGAFFVAVFTPLGGYLVSYGFIIALRGREEKENSQLS